MIKTDKQIIKIAEKVLTDIKFDYNKDKEFWVEYTENKSDFRSTNIEKGWTVGIKWYDPDYLGGNEVTSFLLIDDITGEPELFNARSGGGGNWVIKKDKAGKYFVESNY